MEKRVEILREYDLLDTLPEREFDDIVELASVFFGMPISLISLLDSHRQWFKAKVGLGATETPIEQAFCYHAIQAPDEVFVVPDSLADDRFKTNPLATGEPHVRFYAGAPLVTDEGYALGTLCVIDKQPRQFTPEQGRILQILAAKVTERFEARRNRMRSQLALAAANNKTAKALNRLLVAEKVAGVGHWYVDYKKDEIYWSPEMYRIFDIPQDTPMDLPRWRDMIHADDLGMLVAARESMRPGYAAVSFDIRIRTAKGTEKWLRYTLESNDTQQLVGTALDITDRKEAELRKEHYIHTLEEMLFALSHKVRRPAANILGIAEVLQRDKTSEAEMRSLAPMMKTAAGELDGYLREMNDFIYQHRNEIHGGK
ncbi:MAG: GAF domain-containing protein [Bacteroidetes bacterium]|nr:GAF domain-containing protein [Bacteroidota bacterium]